MQRVLYSTHLIIDIMLPLIQFEDLYLQLFLCHPDQLVVRVEHNAMFVVITQHIHFLLRQWCRFLFIFDEVCFVLEQHRIHDNCFLVGRDQVVCLFIIQFMHMIVYLLVFMKQEFFQLDFQLVDVSLNIGISFSDQLLIQHFLRYDLFLSLVDLLENLF